MSRSFTRRAWVLRKAELIITRSRESGREGLQKSSSLNIWWQGVPVRLFGLDSDIITDRSFLHLIQLLPLIELEQLSFSFLHCIGIDCIGIALMSHWHWLVAPCLVAVGSGGVAETNDRDPTARYQGLNIVRAFLGDYICLLLLRTMSNRNLSHLAGFVTRDRSWETSLALVCWPSSAGSANAHSRLPTAVESHLGPLKSLIADYSISYLADLHRKAMPLVLYSPSSLDKDKTKHSFSLFYYFYQPRNPSTDPPEAALPRETTLRIQSLSNASRSRPASRPGCGSEIGPVANRSEPRRRQCHPPRRAGCSRWTTSAARLGQQAA